MRVHVLQHVPFEGLGIIEQWLISRQAEVTYTRFFESPILPECTEVDFVIALGGPMSVNDEHEYPWLGAEKRFIAEAIAAGCAVLGICLGAQLMANALGARVYPGQEKEIGWFPVVAEAHDRAAFAFPEQALVFHWHGETFDLPAQAQHLASGAACPHQAFQIGARAIGLQFHLEMTPQSVDTIVRHCHAELTSGHRFIATEAALRATPGTSFTESNDLMMRVLDYLARDIA